MILGGADIQTQSSNMVEAQTTLSISQLIVFNSTKRRRSSEKSPSLYHSAEREPPLAVYLGMMTHAETRKKALVDDLYHLGLSISYDRVLEISTQMGNNVCALYESEEVVCPPKLNKKVFTTAAVDNIDHNPSSSTATFLATPHLPVPFTEQEFRYFSTLRKMTLEKNELLSLLLMQTQNDLPSYLIRTPLYRLSFFRNRSHLSLLSKVCR